MNRSKKQLYCNHTSTERVLIVQNDGKDSNHTYIVKRGGSLAGEESFSGHW